MTDPVTGEQDASRQSLSPSSDELSMPPRELPLVSVVMPSFNQGRFIEESIQSVLQQNYPRIELIVIDGGSTDNTVEILSKYDSQIAYWHSRPDRGQSHALNLGFSQATGQIMAWLNSDDLQLPGAISAVVEVFRSYPSTQLVIGDWITVDEAGRFIERHYAIDMNRLHILLEGFTCHTQAMFWSRQLHARFGGFDEQLNWNMDYDMILHFATLASRHVKRSPATLGAYRRYATQKTSLTDSDLIALEHQRIADAHNVNWKFGKPARSLVPLFRVRRAWWYFRRGGWRYLCSKFKGRSRGLF